MNTVTGYTYNVQEVAENRRLGATSPWKNPATESLNAKKCDGFVVFLDAGNGILYPMF